jgi:hypothetical protein
MRDPWSERKMLSHAPCCPSTQIVNVKHDIVSHVVGLRWQPQASPAPFRGPSRARYHGPFLMFLGR